MAQLGTALQVLPGEVRNLLFQWRWGAKSNPMRSSFRYHLNDLQCPPDSVPSPSTLIPACLPVSFTPSLPQHTSVPCHQVLLLLSYNEKHLCQACPKQSLTHSWWNCLLTTKTPRLYIYYRKFKTQPLFPLQAVISSLAGPSNLRFHVLFLSRVLAFPLPAT